LLNPIRTFGTPVWPKPRMTPLLAPSLAKTETHLSLGTQRTFSLRKLDKNWQWLSEPRTEYIFPQSGGKKKPRIDISPNPKKKKKKKEKKGAAETKLCIQIGDQLPEFPIELYFILCFAPSSVDSFTFCFFFPSSIFSFPPTKVPTPSLL
jgi:hypothetical protein